LRKLTLRFCFTDKNAELEKKQEREVQAFLSGDFPGFLQLTFFYRKILTIYINLVKKILLSSSSGKVYRTISLTLKELRYRILGHTKHYQQSSLGP
jgi:hypothetical protein